VKVFINGVGICGPGLTDWSSSRNILAGHQPYIAQALPRLPGQILPATERRRSTPITRLAVTVAEQAITADTMPEDLATVFASSGGEVETAHQIFSQLASDDRQISPIQFHNSVHNAAIGYWSIATGQHGSATSFSAFDNSFSAGLLEAASQTVVEQIPVLLVAYDVPPPPPLAAFRPLHDAFGMALLLSQQQQESSLAALAIDIKHGQTLPVSIMDNPVLEVLRTGNPAARALPLLAGLARSEPASVTIDSLLGCITLNLTPCR
jgi:hypothetical protein